MKKMRTRLLSLALVLVMVFTMLPTTVLAASPEMTLRVADAQAVAGSTVDVTLNLEENPGVAALKVKVAFDTDVLTLINVDFNEAMGGQFQMPQTMKSPVSLTWYNGAENFTEETASFVTLTFMVSETAAPDSTTELSVTYNPKDIYNITETDISLNVVDGVVSINRCVPGDINGDSETNMKDLSRLFQYLADWDVAVNPLALDTNGDGSVDLKDQTRLFQYLADWDVKLYPELVSLKNYLYGYFVEDTQAMGTGCYYTDIVNFDDTMGWKNPATRQPIDFDTLTSLGVPGSMSMYDTVGKLARYVVNQKDEIEVQDSNDFGAVVEDGYVALGGSAIYDNSNNAVVSTNDDTWYMVRTFDWATGTSSYQAHMGSSGLPKAIFSEEGREDYSQKIQYLTNQVGIAAYVFIDAVPCGREEPIYLTGFVGTGEEVLQCAALNGWNIYSAIMTDNRDCYIASEQAQLTRGYLAEVVKVGTLTYKDLPVYVVQGELSTGVNVKPSMDCFGRPATLWTVYNENGAQLLRKTYPATPDYTFTENVDLVEELSDLYSYEQGNQNYAKVTTYKNGAFVNTANTLKAASKLTGNGILTEVFVDGDEIIVIIIETFISRVDHVTKQPACVYLDNGMRVENSLGLKEDDYVMYHQCAGGAIPSVVAPGNHTDAIVAHVATATVGMTIYLHDIWKVEPTVENVIGASVGTHVDFLDASYFESADRKFEYAANYNASCIYADGSVGYLTGRAPTPSDLISVTNFNAGMNGVMAGNNVYDVYVNEHGYVMYYVMHFEELDYQYGYIVEDSHDFSSAIIDGVSRREYSFDIVDFSTGYNEDVAAESYTWMTTESIDNYSYELGHLTRYFINEDGQVELSQIATEVEEGYLVPGVAKIYGATAADGSQIIANNYTQYMVRTYDFAAQEYTYNVYVGYRNLPSTLLGYKWINNGVVDNTGEDGDYMATLQYLTGSAIDPDADVHLATHVFIDVVYVGVQEAFYLLNFETVDSELALYPFINDYNVYAALINGEKAYVAIADDDAWGIGGVPSTGVNNALYIANLQVVDSCTVNGLPIYVAMNAVAPAAWKVLSISGGLVTVDQILPEFGGRYIQIADDAAINVIYPGYTEDPMDYEEVCFAVFGGEGVDPEERDAAFEAFFSYFDWYSVNAYATYEEVGDTMGTAQEITELWIVLDGRILY